MVSLRILIMVSNIAVYFFERNTEDFENEFIYLNCFRIKERLIPLFKTHI